MSKQSSSASALCALCLLLPLSGSCQEPVLLTPGETSIEFSSQRFRTLTGTDLSGVYWAGVRQGLEKSMAEIWQSADEQFEKSYEAKNAAANPRSLLLIRILPYLRENYQQSGDATDDEIQQLYAKGIHVEASINQLYLPITSDESTAVRSITWLITLPHYFPQLTDLVALRCYLQQEEIEPLLQLYVSDPELLWNKETWSQFGEET